MAGIFATIFGKPAAVVAAETAVLISVEKRTTAASRLSATIDELLQRNDELTGRNRNVASPSSSRD